MSNSRSLSLRFKLRIIFYAAIICFLVELGYTYWMLSGHIPHLPDKFTSLFSQSFPAIRRPVEAYQRLPEGQALSKQNPHGVLARILIIKNIISFDIIYCSFLGLALILLLRASVPASKIRGKSLSPSLTSKDDFGERKRTRHGIFFLAALSMLSWVVGDWYGPSAYAKQAGKNSLLASDSDFYCFVIFFWFGEIVLLFALLIHLLTKESAVAGNVDSVKPNEKHEDLRPE